MHTLLRIHKTAYAVWLLASWMHLKHCYKHNFDVQVHATRTEGRKQRLFAKTYFSLIKRRSEVAEKKIRVKPADRNSKKSLSDCLCVLGGISVSERAAKLKATRQKRFAGPVIEAFLFCANNTVMQNLTTIALHIS